MTHTNSEKGYLHFLVTMFQVALLVSSIVVSIPSSCVANAQTQTTYRETKEIFVNGGLTSGFFLGVNSSGNRTDWVTSADNSIRLAYPTGQSWGAVFITYGPIANRNSTNLSTFQNISLTVKGETGGESVQVGIKDAADPDDGSEIKLYLNDITTQWKTYEFKLSQFTSA